MSGAPAEVAAPERAVISIEVARSFDAPAPGADAWNELVERSEGTVYQTHEWLSSWWHTYGAGRAAHIILFRDGGELVGIAPFFRARGGVLRFIGSGEAYGRSGGMFLDDGPSDYLDIIVDPAWGDAVGRALAGHLAGVDSRARRVEMVNLRPDGPAMRHAVPHLSASGAFTVSVTDGDVCSGIDVAAPLPEYIRSLDAGARRRYNQAAKALDAAPDSVRMATAGEWDAMYADLVRLHQARWNRAGFPGLFRSRSGAEFQARAARALAARGWIWFAGLYDGPECLASRLAFRFRGRMYDYLSGFDDSPAAAKKRPGMALLMKMYHDAFTGGMRVLDLLRGDEKYKTELTADRRTLRNVTVRPAGAPSFGSRVSDAAGFAAFLAAREARLLGVQVSRRGPIPGIAGYVRFRSQRFSNKFSGGKDRTGND